MSWAVGFDTRWGRDIGYGVPATCDFPGCGAAIDRGLAYVCGGEPYGGEHGCGLYFCGDHLTGTVEYDGWDGERWAYVCERCEAPGPPFGPTPDTAEWLEWKLTDESWAQWRAQNPAQAEQARTLLGSCS